MSWARIDDSYPHHPKIIAAGPQAMAVDVAGICYCARLLTDGFVHENAIGVLGPFKNVQKLIDRLVEVKRWETVKDGWRVHDYLDYNPSRDQVLREREAARERMAKVRAKSREPSGEQQPNVRATPPHPTPGDVDPSPDFDLVHRVSSACVRPNIDEARRVVELLREHVDDRLLDEAAGYALAGEIKPQRPAYFLDLVRNWAGQRGVSVPKLTLKGAVS